MTTLRIVQAYGSSPENNRKAKYYPLTIGSQIWIEVGEGAPITKISVIGVSSGTKYGDIREPFDPVVYRRAARITCRSDVGPASRLTEPDRIALAWQH